jgi:hypothetical protein
MTDFLEPSVVGTPLPDAKPSTDPASWTVRQLVAALAELEDALRDRHELTGSSVPPYLQAAIDREQAILAELHRRSPAPVPLVPDDVVGPVTSVDPTADAEPTPA